MADEALTAELARYGPRQACASIPTPAEADAYCRTLARTHYENFTVASLLLPRALRRHFFAIYAYCRWADDLADETSSSAESLALLDWWEAELDDCYRGRARHPVFVALRSTVEEFSIPRDPFAHLLVAFRQDQRVTRYETTADLLNYCRYSANPVGRLVLYLGRSHNDRTAPLSDSICTGLQLANFCQDVARDYDRGRIYLPLETCRTCGLDEASLARREHTAAFRKIMQVEVNRARGYLIAGRPLVSLIPRELRCDIALFIEGGLSILNAVERIDYDVWHQRPVVSKRRLLALLGRCWWQTRWSSREESGG